MSRLLLNRIPLWKGQTQKGVKIAPTILEKLIRKIHSEKNPQSQLISSRISDRCINTTSNIQKTIYDDGINLLNYYQDGDMIINLGGDHGISMGTVPVMVFRYPDLKVVWVDAHTDINSPETSLTGNYHGMPVYFMSELSDPTDNNKLKLENLCYYGIRDLDKAEQDIIIDHDIKNYTTNEVKSDRDEIIDQIDFWLGDSPIHLSIDVDALDPEIFPSTGVTASNGLSLDDVMLLCERIKRKNLVSMDLVEFNPEIGSNTDIVTSLNTVRVIMDKLI